jgi:hypothetical protein
VSSDVVRTYARMGASLGAAVAVMSEAGRAFNAAFAGAVRAVAEAAERDRQLARARALDQLTPERRDAISRRRYEHAVRHHRQAAGVHLQREVKRVRAELGLR